jgi:hypothetical protein
MNAPSRRLTLKEAPETAQVKEAKEAARLAGLSGDHAVTNWALRLIEARDLWRNRAPPGPTTKSPCIVKKSRNRTPSNRIN